MEIYLDKINDVMKQKSIDMHIYGVCLNTMIMNIENSTRFSF